MAGGAGDDLYVVDNSADLVVEAENAGMDMVRSNVTHTLSANVDNLTLTGSAAINGTGNNLANVIIGNSAANVIDGGSGIDTMIGGGGNDTYIVDDSADAAIETANAGIDTVHASADYTLSANVENLTLTGSAGINGTGNDLGNTLTGNDADNSLYGDSGNDTLIGNAGNDLLDGGSGVDSMSGGTGDDTYVVDSTDDAVVEVDGEGVDLVRSSITYTLADSLEDLTLTGTDNLNGSGNAGVNRIIGNSGDNVLSGLAGDDTITANGGNDLLDGGAGADIMAGGTGDDTYMIDNAADSVTENDMEGNDTVISSFNYILEKNVENLVLTGNENLTGAGNDLDNTLTGNSGSNTLDGGTGADSLIGGAGGYIYCGQSRRQHDRSAQCRYRHGPLQRQPHPFRQCGEPDSDRFRQHQWHR